MKKILIIEDDKKITRYLELELVHEGYLVDIARDGEEGLEKFKTSFYDLILLDLMMPKLSGEETCKKIREISEVPIIVLTAKDQTSNKIQLLDTGADDYLVKPFDIEELFARMRVIFRNKINFCSEDFLYYDKLRLDINKKILHKNNSEIGLTKTEYDVLHFLMLNKEIVNSREKILNEIWGYDYNGEDKIVDVYINILRKKMDSDSEKYIHTLRGFGYVLKREGKK